MIFSYFCIFITEYITILKLLLNFRSFLIFSILNFKYLTILKSLRILFFKIFGIVLLKFLFQKSLILCYVFFFSFLNFWIFIVEIFHFCEIMMNFGYLCIFCLFSSRNITILQIIWKFCDLKLFLTFYC